MNEPAAVHVVARNLRLARTRLGLTIDQLAARAGVSKGALVGLENAAANPNLATLVRLADALAMPVSELVAEPAGPDIRVVRPDDVEPLWRGEAGGTARLLLTTVGSSPVEVWRWRLVSGEPYTSEPHPSGFVETVTVIEGRLGLTLAGSESIVDGGSTATYRGDLPHAIRALGEGPCELLMTVHLLPRS
jgi:transcriptional regulator with XRE-family HTH domain